TPSTKKDEASGKPAEGEAAKDGGGGETANGEKSKTAQEGTPSTGAKGEANESSQRSSAQGENAEQKPEAASGTPPAEKVQEAQRATEQALEQLARRLSGSDETAAEPEVALEEKEADAEIPIDPMREKIEDTLAKFVEEQRAIVEQSNNLPAKPVEDLTAEEKESFKDIAAAEDDLSKMLEETVSDLSKLPEQDFSASALRDEFIEILAEVELAEDALELQSKLMAIKEEQIGLELAEKLVNNLPSWLSDTPDYQKWDLEEPSEEYDVPMAELPEELTDLMGELIQQEEDMIEAIEDESSSWADSIDAGSGWAVEDGPISNMSATGKTGNVLPNSSEIGGRSGEGRTGRAHGEFVEKTAQGKGGRNTPTRLSPDPYSPGVVEDSSTDPVGGATGGGKLSGAGGAGLPGPVPPEVQKSMGRLAGMQADIRAKAEQAEFKLQVINIPMPHLKEAIGVMKEIEADLRDFRYENVLEKNAMALDRMRDSRETMQQQIKVRGERNVYLPKKDQMELLDAMDEEVVPEYRDMVADYFRTLAESR
ncbi:MAG: hypothetical protein QG656_1242, partial [Candidatus Hydrogenedentes bacterium]|nr:hypothetical protein [Candidatus Hydrogenedentota bacterium]